MPFQSQKKPLELSEAHKKRCFFRQVLLSHAPFSTQTGQT